MELKGTGFPSRTMLFGTLEKVPVIQSGPLLQTPSSLEALTTRPVVRMAGWIHALNAQSEPSYCGITGGLKFTNRVRGPGEVQGPRAVVQVSAMHFH